MLGVTATALHFLWRGPREPKVGFLNLPWLVSIHEIFHAIFHAYGEQPHMSTKKMLLVHQPINRTTETLHTLDSVGTNTWYSVFFPHAKKLASHIVHSTLYFFQWCIAAVPHVCTVRTHARTHARINGVREPPLDVETYVNTWTAAWNIFIT